MKKDKLPNIVTLAILTLITTVFWVFFSVYRVFTKEQPFVVPEDILTPIDPNIDSGTLSRLTDRKYIEENTIPDVRIEGSIFSTVQPVSNEENEETNPPEIPIESPTPISSPSGGTSQ